MKKRDFYFFKEADVQRRPDLFPIWSAAQRETEASFAEGGALYYEKRDPDATARKILRDLPPRECALMDEQELFPPTQILTEIRTLCDTTSTQRVLDSDKPSLYYAKANHHALLFAMSTILRALAARMLPAAVSLDQTVASAPALVITLDGEPPAFKSEEECLSFLGLSSEKRWAILSALGAQSGFRPMLSTDGKLSIRLCLEAVLPTELLLSAAYASVYETVLMLPLAYFDFTK